MLNLTQHVNFTTRKKSVLDLFLTNRPGLIERCEPLPGFGDHDTAVISDILCHPAKIKPIQRKVYIWKRANLTALKDQVQNETNRLIESESTATPINTLWSQFKDVLLTAQDAHVPTKMTSSRYTQPWFNNDCKRATRKKKRRYRVYKRTKLDKDYDKYIRAEKEARKTCDNAYNNYIQDNILSDKKNTKKFFSFIKAKKTIIV